MKFNKLKFNIIICSLVLIMALGIGLSSAIIGDVIDNGNLSSGDSDLPSDIGGDDTVTDDSEPAAELPAFKTWHKLLEYSYGIMAKGYESTQTVLANVPVVDKQYMEITSKFNPTTGKSSQATFAKCASSMGENYFWAKYNENGMFYSRFTENYSFENKTYSFTNEPIFSEKISDRHKRGFPCAAEQLLVFNSTNSEGYLDKTSDKNYYIIQLKFDMRYVTELYKNSFLSTGKISDMRPGTINAIIKINKNNAHIKTIELTEVYEVKIPLLGFRTCNSTSKETFKMNENVVVDKIL